MLLKKFFEGFIHGIGFLFAFALVFGVYAAGWHLASEILPGQFAVGNFSFNGSVGIGTNSPESLLFLESENPQIRINNLGSTKWHVGVNDDGGFRIAQTGIIDAIVVKNLSGNVGIGTSNPGSKLHVEGQIRSSNYPVAYGDGAFKVSKSGDIVGLSIESLGSNARTWDIVGIVSSATDYFGIRDHTAGALRMIIDENGNVGIGNTNPIHPLDVVGDIKSSARVKGAVLQATNSELADAATVCAQYGHGAMVYDANNAEYCSSDVALLVCSPHADSFAVFCPVFE